MTDLKEQTYTTSRKYYIGTKKKTLENLQLSTNYSSTPVIFATPQKIKAIEYCYPEDFKGRLYEIKLSKFLHIFNARSESDLNKLSSIIVLSDQQKENLKKDDFFFWRKGILETVGEGFYDRDVLITTISQLKLGDKNQFGCDGFFNFERGEENNYPSLGLFSLNSFEVKESYSYEEYYPEYEYYRLKENKTPEQKKKELRFLKILKYLDYYRKQ